MSEIWYRVCRSSTEIERTEWDKSTAHFLVKGTRKDAKSQNYYCYFQTWQQAKENIRQRIAGEISYHEGRAGILKRHLGEVETMQEPSND